jgi:hypothetical protein
MVGESSVRIEEGVGFDAMGAPIWKGIGQISSLPTRILALTEELAKAIDAKERVM